jgi:membrane protein YqaA with SNARE-associated domain
LHSGEVDSATLEERDPAKSGLVSRSLRFLFRFFGGWVGVALFVGTIAAGVVLFLVRDHLSSLGSLGYVGAALIAFLGNVPIVPAFPWLLLIAPMGGIYSTWGLVTVCAVAAGLGETVPFFLGSSLYKAHKENRWITRLASLPQWLRVLGVFIISLSPVFSFPGLASAVLRIPLWAMIIMKVTTEALKLWLVLEAVTFAEKLLLG